MTFVERMPADTGGVTEILRCLLSGPRRWLALVPAAAIACLLLIEFLRSGYFLQRFLQGF